MNLIGRNEVILFPANLTINQKTDVFSILNKVPRPVGAREQIKYDEVMELRQFKTPHDADDNNYLKSFPTKEQLQILKDDKGIEYECLILEPGELLFIDAGRVHIFRKMSYKPLPETDPFFERRGKYIENMSSADVDCFSWNISVAWDFLYIGYKRDNIRQLAQTKWVNSVCAAVKKVPSQGCIEHPLMVLLTKYGKMEKSRRNTGFLKQIDTLLSALDPVIYGIIKYHGDKLPITNSTGEGTVITKSLSSKFKTHRELLESSLINFRCDSCNFHLSNHFLTCRSCLLFHDYTVNICTSCYLQKEQSLLIKDIGSKLHVPSEKESPKNWSICQCSRSASSNTNEINDPPLERFNSAQYPIDMTSVFYDETAYNKFYKKNRPKNHNTCDRCKICFTCHPDKCTCHCCYELVHVWATEQEMRQLYVVNRLNCKSAPTYIKLPPRDLAHPHNVLLFCVYFLIS